MKTARLFSLLLTALALAGAPLFGQGGAKADKKNYVHTLGLADRVRVAVYQEEDLTSLTRIDARGQKSAATSGTNDDTSTTFPDSFTSW